MNLAELEFVGLLYHVCMPGARPCSNICEMKWQGLLADSFWQTHGGKHKCQFSTFIYVLQSTLIKNVVGTYFLYIFQFALQF